MDYAELARNILIYFSSAAAIAVLLWQGHLWWQERHERRSLKAIQQLEDEHYAGLHEALLRHVDALIRKVDRQ